MPSGVTKALAGIVLVLALVAVCITAWAQKDVALVSNGDFEADTQGWQADEGMRAAGRFAVEVDENRKSRVLRIENTSEEGSASLWQEVVLAPGRTYELTGYCRSTRLQEGAGVAFYCFGADGKLLKREWAYQIPSWGISGWRELWAEFSPPKDTVSVQMRLIIYKQGTVWLDDLGLRETEARRGEVRRGEPITDGGFSVRRYSTPRPVYTMDVADLDGDGVLEFLLGDIDGVLRCQEEPTAPDGEARVVWERDLGGLCFDLDCGDLNGDGTEEILACTADREGNLRAMDSKGETLWTHAVQGTLFHHVTVADLDGDGKAEVFATHDNQLGAFARDGEVKWQATFGGPRFRAVAVGDVTDSPGNEVAASLTSQKLFAAAMDAEGRTLWTYQPRQYARLDTEDIVVADVDGDGAREVVLACNGGLVLCLRNGETVWEAPRERQKLWPKHRDVTANLSGCQAHIAVADFCPDRPGLETLVSLLDTVWLLDGEGRYLWESDSGLVLRRMVMGERGEVFVPSSSLRDASFYQLSFVRGEGNALAEYVVPNPIYDTLDGLYERACALPALPSPEGVTGKFHVIYANLTWPTSQWGSYKRLEQTHEFLKTKESDHLEFLFMLWPKDLPVELHRGGMVEQSEILDVVRFLEKLGRPFLFFADHGCSPNLSLDTIEKTLQLAPNTCRGMYVAENTANYPSAKWGEFVAWAMKVMDLCRKYGGKKVVFKEMFDSWAFLPADRAIQNTLLRPEYRDTLVAMYATNNPYAPELQIGGMAGLKHAGLVSDWGISTQYWNWSWGEQTTRQSVPNLCPADVILQIELSTACLGGRWLHIEGGQEYLERSDTVQVSQAAKRHRDLVYELIRKNVLLPVPDQANASFSDVVVARREHPLVGELRSRGDTIPQLGPPCSRPVGPLRSGLLGVNHALQTVGPGFFSAYAYGNTRYVQTMAPQTPYGYVRIVPECEATRAFLADKRVIETDGDRVFLRSLGNVQGEPVDAEEAGGSVLQALREEAGKLPVRAPGAAVLAHRLRDGYRVFLLDPGYMCPEGVRTSLEVTGMQGEGEVQARDVLTGERLEVREGKVDVSVPAGAFRVIEVRLRGNLRRP